MKFEQILNEYKMIEEATIQAIIGQSKAKGELVTQGASGKILDRRTQKPVQPNEVFKIAEKEGLKDPEILSKLKAFVQQRNSGAEYIDQAVEKFKSQKAASDRFRKSYSKA